MPARKPPRPRQHNYIAAISRFWAAHVLAPGEYVRLEVLHDTWCGIYAGGRCDCDPEVRLVRPVERN